MSEYINFIEILINEMNYEIYSQLFIWQLVMGNKAGLVSEFNYLLIGQLKMRNYSFKRVQHFTIIYLSSCWTF